MFDSSNADMLLRQHAATAAAISTLFYPHAEVVIHDLETGLVAGIWNAFSGRKVGMESLIEDVLGWRRQARRASTAPMKRPARMGGG